MAAVGVGILLVDWAGGLGSAVLAAVVGRIVGSGAAVAVAVAAGPLAEGARRAGSEGTAAAAGPSASAAFAIVEAAAGTAGESWRKSDPCSDPAYNTNFHLWFSAPPSR